MTKNLSRNHVGPGRLPGRRRRPRRTAATTTPRRRPAGSTRPPSARARRPLPGARRGLGHLPARTCRPTRCRARRAGRGQPLPADEPLPGADPPISPAGLGPAPQVNTRRDQRVDEFLEVYTQGPQTREPGRLRRTAASTSRAPPRSCQGPTAPRAGHGDRHRPADGARRRAATPGAPHPAATPDAGRRPVAQRLRPRGGRPAGAPSR